jgi:hypothetical protein
MRYRSTVAALIVGLAVTTASILLSDRAVSAEAVYRDFSKVMVVVLENTDYEDAIEQPFLNSLIKRGVLLTNFTAEAHPPQPNYVASVSGSTHRVTSDANVISISVISATCWRPRDFSGRSTPRVIREAAFSVLGAAPTFASMSRS